MSSQSPEYLTKAIAAERLGVSVRRLLEIAGYGRIRRQYRRDVVTGRKQVYFHEGDIEREKERMTDSPRKESAVVKIEGAALPHLPAVQIPSHIWLTVAEAAAYTRLPEAFLLRLIDESKLAAFDVGPRRGGRYRIKRESLDGLQA